MNETVLIFGSGGQDGHYLHRLCSERGMAVATVSRSSGSHPGDVADPEFVQAVVAQIRPDYVFHLAAWSTTAHEALAHNHATIAGGTWNVCEAVRSSCPDARVFITGTGLQFENRGQPIDENCPFAATSPYAVERIHSAYAARYFRSLGLRTYVGYLFHHDSPRRRPDHVSMKIAQAAVRISSGNRVPLELGATEVEKEWGFAEDIAAAMLTLVEQDDVPEAVLGTGVAHPISRWLDLCFGRVGLDWTDHVRPVEGFQPQFARLVSDPKTIRTLGWEPRVEIDELSRLMMREVSALATT